MNRALIVHAHPEPNSFSAAMKDAAVEELTAQGLEVRVADLYASEFNPVASAADFAERRNAEYLVYALEQRHAHGADTLAPDIKEHLENLLWADLVVLNFPVFWFSVPAILKGWIDRVFLSGPVYGGRRFYDRGGMAGKKAWVTATIGGQRHMFGHEAIHGELQPLLSHLLRGTLAYAGFDVLTPFVAYHVPYISGAERTALLGQFRREVADVGRRRSLKFPRMEAFDELLHPIPAPQSVWDVGLWSEDSSTEVMHSSQDVEPRS